MYVRSLISSAGWSKKTLRAAGLAVTRGGMAIEVSVGDQRSAKLAMRANAGTNGDAEIEQRPRARGEESGELHARKLTRPGNSAIETLSPVGRLNKTVLPVFHGVKTSRKTTVQSQSQ